MAWASPGAWSATTQSSVSDPAGAFGGSTAGGGISGIGQIPTLSDYLQRMNWQLAYDYATKGAGLQPQGAFNNFVRSQQDIVQRAYNASLVDNPDQTHQQFLGTYGGPNGILDTMRQQFQKMPYQLRGEDPRAWGQATMGWVPRI